MKIVFTQQKTLIYIYLSLWCFYSLQGVFLSGASIVPKIILFVLLSISLYFFVKANREHILPRVLNVLTIIVVVFSIYGIIRLLFDENMQIAQGEYLSRWDYLKNILMSFLPVYTFYVVAEKDIFSESDMSIWTIVFLIVSIISFYWNQNKALLIAQSSHRSIDEVTNNAAYIILPIIILLPVFLKRPVLQFVFLFVCLYHVLISMKRGALLCGLVATIWLFYYSFRVSKNSNRKLLTSLFIGVVVFGMVFMFNDLLQSSDWFSTRMERTLEGDSSDRDEIYSMFWNYFINESNPFRFLFGNGADASVKIFKNFAHNDWLEMAINNGAVMLVLYFVYWVTLFRTARKAKGNTVCFMILNLYFIIYFLKSWFSMSYGHIEICASVALGYALANSEKSISNNDNRIIQ